MVESAGTRSTDLPLRNSLNEFVGHSDTGAGLETVRVPMTSVGAQLGASLALASGVVVVISRTISAPPTSNTVGDAYIVGPSPTGAWAGKVNNIARWDGAAWVFTVPISGFTVFVLAENNIYAWIAASSAWGIITGTDIVRATYAQLTAITSAPANARAEVVADIVGQTVSRARASNVVTVETLQAHGLTTGNAFNISNLGGVGYNGRFTVASVPTTTKITYTASGADESTVIDHDGILHRNGIYYSNGAGGWVFVSDPTQDPVIVAVVNTAVATQQIALTNLINASAPLVVYRAPFSVEGGPTQIALDAFNGRLYAPKQDGFWPTPYVLTKDTAAQDLLDGLADGFALNPSLESYSVIDSTTPSNTRTASIDSALPSNFYGADKVCVQSDGSLRYARHNAALYSEDYSQTQWVKTNLSPASGQVGSDGITTDASLLTATSTTAKMVQTYSSTLNSMNAVAFVVKADSSQWCYLEISDGTTHRTWFDLLNGVVGTSDAGNNAAISRFGDIGEPLSAGFYHIIVARTVAQASTNFGIGISDADASTTVTSGRKIVASKAQKHRGIRRVDYIKTTTALMRGAAYDWTWGKKALLTEGVASTHNGLWSADATQSVWIKTNCSAALDATGPDSEACSTVTASANNATVLQSITSATANQSFAPFVRRKTGTGAIFMTLNGGTTWVDITATIGAVNGAYLRQPLSTTSGANPTIGFKIAVNGDEIQFSYANSANVGFVSSPVQTFGAALTRTGDIPKIPFSLPFPIGDVMSLFADMNVSNDVSGTQRCHVGYQGTTHKLTVGSLGLVTSEHKVLMTATDAEATTEYLFSSTTPTARLQVAMRRQEGADASTVNRCPVTVYPGAEAMTLTDVLMGGQAPVWINRLISTPIAIADDDLLRWKLDETAVEIDNTILDSAMMARYGELPVGATYPGTWFRDPICEVLTESDTAFSVIEICMNHSAAVGGEVPSRLVQRTFTIDKKTGRITGKNDLTVSLESPGFDTGTGHLHSGSLLKTKIGPFAGRLHHVYTRQYSPSGTLVDDDRRIDYRYSDDNGKTWSTGVTIVGPGHISGAGAIVTGDNGSGIQMTSGPYTGRILFSGYTKDYKNFAFFSDDGGATWAISTTLPANPTNFLGDEPSIFARTNGDIIMILRDEHSAGGYQRGVAESTNGGVAFTFDSILPISAINVNCSMLMDDPVGQYGLWGRTFMTAPTTNGVPLRTNFKVYKSTTQNFDFQVIATPFGTYRQVGYSCLKKLTGNMFFLAFESARQSNVSDSVYGMVLRLDD